MYGQMNFFNAVISGFSPVQTASLVTSVKYPRRIRSPSRPSPSLEVAVVREVDVSFGKVRTTRSFTYKQRTFKANKLLTTKTSHSSLYHSLPTPAIIPTARWRRQKTTQVGPWACSPNQKTHSHWPQTTLPNTNNPKKQIRENDTKYSRIAPFSLAISYSN